MDSNESSPSQPAPDDSAAPPWTPDEIGLTRREALKAGALGVLAGLAPLSAANGAQKAAASDAPFTTAALLFDEPANRPTGSIVWPVTVGVPFSNGALASLD